MKKKIAKNRIMFFVGFFVLNIPPMGRRIINTHPAIRRKPKSPFSFELTFVPTTVSVFNFCHNNFSFWWKVSICRNPNLHGYMIVQDSALSTTFQELTKLYASFITSDCMGESQLNNLSPSLKCSPIKTRRINSCSFLCALG